MDPNGYGAFISWEDFETILSNSLSVAWWFLQSEFFHIGSYSFSYWNVLEVGVAMSLACVLVFYMWDLRKDR